VTTGLYIVGTVGGVAMGFDTYSAIENGDWNQVAFNGGAFIGGSIAGVLGSPRLSNMPFRSKVIPLDHWLPSYEIRMMYNPTFEGEFSPPGLTWMSTAPTPLSGAASSAFSSGLLYVTPEARKLFK